MSPYASNTSVSVERSKGEIENILTRYGASQFMNGFKPGLAMIAFEVNTRRVRFELPIPEKTDFALAPAGRQRSEGAMEEAWNQEVRRRWRALALAIKAKLEVVQSGISTFEEEFLSCLVIPGGKTIGQTMIPQIEQIYESGKMPPLLPGPK